MAILNRSVRPIRLAYVISCLTAVALILASALPARAQVLEYYHLDAIGNVLAVTNQAGQIIEAHDYLPFGEELCGTSPCSVAGQPKRFTGKERDAETGLDYFGARYYRGNLGRFTSVDPIIDQQAALGDPQRWNRYAYSLNNPLRYIDPDGRATVLIQPLSPQTLERNAAIRAAITDVLAWDPFLQDAIIAGMVMGFFPVSQQEYETTLIMNTISGVAIAPSAGPLVPGMAGRFAALKNLALTGDKLSPHHMPQAALGFTTRAEGGALAMYEAEHMATRTFGAKGIATARADSGLSFRAVLAKDFRDVRSIVGRRYNEGLQALADYYRQFFSDLIAK